MGKRNTHDAEQAIEALAGVRVTTGEQIVEAALEAAKPKVADALGIAGPGKQLLASLTQFGLTKLLDRYAPDWRNRRVTVCARCARVVAIDGAPTPEPHRC